MLADVAEDSGSEITAATSPPPPPVVQPEPEPRRSSVAELRAKLAQTMQ